MAQYNRNNSPRNVSHGREIKATYNSPKAGPVASSEDSGITTCRKPSLDLSISVVNITDSNLTRDRSANLTALKLLKKGYDKAYLLAGRLNGETERVREGLL